MEITVKTLDSKSHKFTDVDDSVSHAPTRAPHPSTRRRFLSSRQITVKQFKERIASQVVCKTDFSLVVVLVVVALARAGDGLRASVGVVSHI